MQQLAATAMQEVRRSVRALREDSEELPLEEAIAHLVKDFQQRIAAMSDTLQLETELGSGWRIIVKIPLQNYPERTERNPSDTQSLMLESYS